MLARLPLNTLFCSFVLTLAACDKSESLGEVETSASESGSSGATEGESGTASDCPTDAMVCPDGTAVGREGPMCEFTPCPEDSGGEQDTGDTSPPSCAPGETLLLPASCPAENGPAVLAEGCYVECGGEDDCGEGYACQAGQSNPCPCPPDAEACCGACAATTSVCLPVSEGDACDALVGQHFESVEELECGIEPDGLGSCNWTVNFDDEGGYLWMYSDLGEGGDYLCDEGTITLLNNPGLAASYDLPTQVLTWDGVAYSKIE